MLDAFHMCVTHVSHVCHTCVFVKLSLVGTVHTYAQNLQAPLPKLEMSPYCATSTCGIPAPGYGIQFPMIEFCSMRQNSSSMGEALSPHMEFHWWSSTFEGGGVSGILLRGL